METDTIERLVRQRLRMARTTHGYSLEELASRTNLSASTISRIETGRRAIGLDVLVPLARALQISLDALLEDPDDEDVIIRPVQHQDGARTTWPLSRVDGRTTAMKVRLETESTPPAPRTHPGHDWLLVLNGRITLLLGERRIEIRPGEAAEFSTTTPHALYAPAGPAELIMIFDREGRRAHLHQ